ncbi:hypothetical protein BDB01DRAFT_839153 [Pilobolus umbonatus]|nr:hypothetical protein BDB01DRAFT_839153 [Pilobolus umbonatus]
MSDESEYHPRKCLRTITTSVHQKHDLSMNFEILDQIRKNLNTLEFGGDFGNFALELRGIDKRCPMLPKLYLTLFEMIPYDGQSEGLDIEGNSNMLFYDTAFILNEELPVTSRITQLNDLENSDHSDCKVLNKLYRMSGSLLGTAIQKQTVISEDSHLYVLYVAQRIPLDKWTSIL